MKQVILTLIIVLSGLQSILAQDIIVRKDGSEVQAKVLEVTPDQIKYQRSDNPDGPAYTENKNRLLKIKYANGLEDVFVKESIPQVWQPPVKKVRKVRYSGLVEVSPYVGLQDWGLEHDRYGDRVHGVCIGTTHGIQLFGKYFLGMGIGANIEAHHVYMPFYFNFRLNLSTEQSHPFLSFSLGTQFGLPADYYDAGSSYLSLGLWSNALLGYQFKKKFYIAFGLTLQDATISDWSGDSWRYTNSEELYGTLGAIAGIGFKF
ncbi:MAG: hypothetical protein LBL04_11055 [Bacteroidales bacterium]|jgi:hypothetical protein|nr:hypothetical protein [Bacteroidales bacterium]